MIQNTFQNYAKTLLNKKKEKLTNYEMVSLVTRFIFNRISMCPSLGRRVKKKFSTSPKKCGNTYNQSGMN